MIGNIYESPAVSVTNMKGISDILETSDSYILLPDDEFND